MWDWSCLPWIVAWSWWKDNVTSTFLTYCHMSHLHWVLQAAPTVTDTHTYAHTHRWLPPLPTNFTSDLFPEDVSWCDWLPLAPQVGTPGPFSQTHTSVPLQLNMHTIMYLLLILTFLLLNGLFVVFHSMACAFFLLFLQIWMSMPHWKNTTTTKKHVSKL